MNVRRLIGVQAEKQQHTGIRIVVATRASRKTRWARPRVEAKRDATRQDGANPKASTKGRNWVSWVLASGAEGH
eukprot:scaffold115657_cov28-Tisochrysis_lutea.AAC.4